MNLNPARLARFSDWAKTLPPRPLPRTVIPVPGEYHLDYIGRLADANHLELLELTDSLDNPAAVILRPGSWKQYQQERLAAVTERPAMTVQGDPPTPPSWTVGRRTGNECIRPLCGCQQYRPERARRLVNRPFAPVVVVAEGLDNPLAT